MWTYGWGLQIDRTLGVEDEVEKTAVLVVAGELGLEGCREVQRLGGLCEAGLYVVGLLGHGEAGGLVVEAVLISDLLLVVGDEGLFLDVAVVLYGADRRHAVLESCHVGGWRMADGGWRTAAAPLAISTGALAVVGGTLSGRRRLQWVRWVAVGAALAGAQNREIEIALLGGAQFFVPEGLTWTNQQFSTKRPVDAETA